MLPFLYHKDMKLNGTLWGKEWMPLIEWDMDKG